MKFKFYDILSHLIPGFIVFVLYLFTQEIAFDNDFIVPATALAFILGYFVNTISSWLEDFFYWTWGGKPSNKLLEGKDIWKIRFYHHEKANELLLQESGNVTKADALFSIASSYATPEVNSRVADFNANYAFSRVILTTVLIASGFVFYMYYDSANAYLITIPLILIAWYRCKQRGYYYAREVLRTYLYVKNQE